MIAPRSLSFALLLVSGALGAWACGDEPLKTRNQGVPPPIPGFDPGNGGSGSGGYGYGSSGAPSTPECPEELKKCAVEFTFPYNGESSVELRGDYRGPESWQAGDALVRDGTTWRVTVPASPGSTVLYKFCIDGCSRADQWVPDPNPAVPQVDDGVGGKNSQRSGIRCSEDEMICDEPPLPPDGVFDWRDAVIYFVFVDRFFDGRPQNNCNVSGVSGALANYHGGDWAGVTQKINEGYFSELGVNTLWLTVPADNTNQAGKGAAGDDHFYSGYHGYWPKELDPLAPESCFGSAQDLKDLVSAAHAKDIKILFDYAMVHVHNTSSVYQQHGDWFWSLDYGPSNHCVCGDGCDWNADGKRCWFTDYLPHWNYQNPTARTYSVQNAVDWAKEYAIDGFRLDAIKHVEDAWLIDLRREVGAQITATQDPPQRFYMVGETFDYTVDNLRYYVDPSTKLDGQFDFPARKELVEKLLRREGTLSQLAAFYDTNDYAYGVNAVMSPFIGNHDIGRVIHMAQDNPEWDSYSNNDKSKSWNNPGISIAAGEGTRPYERVNVAFTVLLTQRGAPLLYYGDEIGLAGAGDPDNRRPMRWSGIESREESVRARIKQLTAIRAEHPALRRGRRTTLDAQDHLWLYRMTTSGDEVFVAVNRDDAEHSSNLLPAGSYRELLGGGTQTGGAFTLPARSAKIFVAE